MKTIGYITFFFIILFLISVIGGCKKNVVTVPFTEGEYTGSHILNSGGIPVSNHVDIIFNQGNFTAGTQSADIGTYAVKGDTVITFKSNFPAYLYPSANYYLTFNDDFNISYKADSLILTKILQSGKMATDELRLKLK